MSLKRHAVLLLLLVLCTCPLKASADPAAVFALLDLERPGLGKVRACCEQNRWGEASRCLLEYYRTRKDVHVPGQDSRTASQKDFLWADDALDHTFHVMESQVWNYGSDINWEYWPVKDIEMRVQLHRHGWWTSLGRAYCTSGDEKYAREYVDEFRDWVRKNPYKPFDVDQKGTVSSGSIDINAPNECFAFRPLEVGIRLLRWCTQFTLLCESESFTPEFLLEFLDAYHHNADVLMHTFSPAGNHLIHQSQGILRAGICFPEFKDSRSWMQAGVDNLNREIMCQSYTDGCHFELDPGYHIGFVESYDSAVRLAMNNGMEDLFPAELRQQLARMTQYYLSYCYPDLSHPCFSDARRGDDEVDVDLLESVALYNSGEVSEHLKWFATSGREGVAPPYKSKGYPQTGFYTFRDDWFDASVVMPVKATERGMWHAQPDFGTFELWYRGVRLMPDAGAYSYSGDEQIERWRAYFKATARHNALTLDGRDYLDPEPELVKWEPEGSVQHLAVRHKAYEGLMRRRDIWFVDGKFFVVMDEVSGRACGALSLGNCLGRGEVSGKGGDYVYKSNEAPVGMRIVMAGPEGSRAEIDSDFCSERFQQKYSRPVLRLGAQRRRGSGVQRFVTVLCPFGGVDVPQVNLDVKRLRVTVYGKEYKLKK